MQNGENFVWKVYRDVIAIDRNIKPQKFISTRLLLKQYVSLIIRLHFVFVSLVGDGCSIRHCEFSQCQSDVSCVTCVPLVLMCSGSKVLCIHVCVCVSVVMNVSSRQFSLLSGPVGGFAGVQVVKYTVYGPSCVVCPCNVLTAHEHIHRHLILADQLIRSCETCSFSAGPRGFQ